MKFSNALFLIGLLSIASQDSAYAQSGTVVNTELVSPSLDASTRRARVYLPPSYDSSHKRYPVAYYLHGGGGGGSQFSFFNWSGHRTADELINNGMMEEMIVVGVDARVGDTTVGSGGYGGSHYANSEFNGNYETYIVRDVVNHIDSTFRTIADRESRGIFGASMGGYGALRYGMLHSDVFGAAYSLSLGIGCFSHPDCPFTLEGDRAVFSDAIHRLLADRGIDDVGAYLDGFKTPEDIRRGSGLPVFSMAAAFAPNLDNTPLLIDLPFELPSLDIIPESRDRWYEHDIFKLLEDHSADLSSLRGLALDWRSRRDQSWRG